MSNDNQPLVDQKLALSLFLDSLLTEPAEEDVSETVAEQIVAPPVVEVAEAVPVQEKEKVVTLVEEAAVEQVEADIQVEEVNLTVVAAETIEVPPAENKTEQAREFQAMLFKVAGLGLAVPLEELSGVVEWKNDLTEMPGRADFYLGILQHLGKSVPVVDTARLVFPKDKLIALAGEDPTERITRIILIDEGRWGLAVDEVAEVITLQHDQVRWRSARTTRKWLLGTVIEHMCALLDTQAFAEKLVSGKE